MKNQKQAPRFALPPSPPSKGGAALAIAFLLGMGMGQNAHAESNYTYNGHTYFLLDATSWTEAQEKAKSLGGNLVTINDQAENDWITSTFKDAKSVWIGYTDQETEGAFKWISGENSVYSNFGNGEPNDYHGNDNSQNYGEDYGHIILGDGKWNDMPNYLSNWEYTPTKGLVEMGDEKPKETVQISGQIKLGTQAGKDVALSGKGLTEECLTDVTGKFNCTIEKGWTGFLTPESKGVSFSPPKISVTDAQTNLEVKTPLVGTTTDSFPLNGVMTSDWVKLKTDKTTWQVETSTGASDDKTAYEGRFSFGSAKIGVNQTAAIQTTINVTQAGQLSFARRVSSNPEHGVLNFEISGKQKNGSWKTLVTEKSSGDVTWEMKNYALTVGQFKLRWTYAKDGAEAKGEDKAWIDAVSYPSSVKVAAKTCEGITAGTVKLMTIKNPTCDQLQAYRVWSKSTRPSRFDEAESFSKDIDGIEASNEWAQNFISGVGRLYGFLNPLRASNVTEGVLDSVGNLKSEAIGIFCDNVIENPIYQSVCGVGQSVLTTWVTEYLKIAADNGATNILANGLTAVNPMSVAPYAIEKGFSIATNLFYAGDANSKTNDINSFNLATDFLDEYYKGGSNQATLRAMAKKYGVENTSLDTLVDALAVAKGYDNGFTDSIRVDFFGDEYSNETVVKSIESVMSKNKNSLNYYRNNLLKKPVPTTQLLLP